MLRNLFNFFLKYYKRYKIFWKYCLGGGTALIVDVGLLYVFTEFFGIWYLFSATLSFVCSAVYNYTFQKAITFKNKNKNYLKQFLSFVVIALVGLAINNTLLYIEVERFKIWYVLAKIIAAAIVLVWNFLANKFFTFKEAQEVKELNET